MTQGKFEAKKDGLQDAVDAFRQQGAAFAGTARLNRWGDGSSGMTVSFRLDKFIDSPDVNPFKGMAWGKEGQTFKLVAVMVADPNIDESPASEPIAKQYIEKTPGEQAVTRAGILANDSAFLAWIDETEPEQAAFYIRQACGVQSRAEFKDSPAALQAFLTMETTFKQQTGRMAESR